MLELFQELFGELGRPLDAETYERELAGMSDPEITYGLARGRPSRRGLRDRRARPPLPRAHGRRLDDPEPVRAAVRLAAAHVPVAVCSGAARSEIEATLAAAGHRRRRSG